MTKAYVPSGTGWLSALKRYLGLSKRKQRQREAQRYHPRLELLESRDAPAAFPTSQVVPIGPTAGASPSNLTEMNGLLYFTANDGSNGQELWKSDGTVAGTQLVKDINP